MQPAEAMSVLSNAFVGFINAISKPNRPLLLFLDDLQWADAFTFRVLRALLVSSNMFWFTVLIIHRRAALL